MAFRIVGLHHVQLAMPPGEEDAGRTSYRDLLGLTEVAKPSELAPRGGLWFGNGSLEGRRRFHVRDPSGNRVELLEPA